MGRTIVILIALVVIAGGVWYYLGMPGYSPAAMTPAATTTTPDTPATTPPASDTSAPASPGTP